MYKYKKIKTNKFKNLLYIFLIMILTSAFTVAVYSMYEKIDISTYDKDGEYESLRTINDSNSSDLSSISYMEPDLENSLENIEDVVEKVTSSVVGISKLKDAGSTIFLKDSVNSLGLGTGVIVTGNGYILSNEHVTGQKYSNCYVTLENGKSYNASVVWSDSSIDLSIIKINANGLKYSVLGDSDLVRVGERVYAIGNPIGFEFQRTVTGGIISAKNRTIKLEEDDNIIYMEDLIQTDATINPGNSGGPLINIKGEIIGINSVKITSAESIGFAVPINIVKPIIEKYRINQDFKEASLGIFAYDKNIIPYIDKSIDINKGIYVAQVSLDSPAYKSGLKVGDIITKIDNLELNKMSDLRCYIYTKEPQDEVLLNIYRNKKELQLKVKLTKK